MTLFFSLPHDIVSQEKERDSGGGIKRRIEVDLTKRFGHKVTIGKVSGTVLTKLIFRDVLVQDPDTDELVMSINRVSMGFNPLKLVQYAGYVPSAISSLELDGAYLRVLRDSDGRWELAKLKPRKDPLSTLPKQPLFSGQVAVENLQIAYEDRRGWGDRHLKQAFKEGLSSLSGKVDIKNEIAQFSLLGTLKSGDSPTKLTGVFDLRKGHYDLDFSMTQLDLGIWGEYVLPFEGYTIDHDKPSLRGNIRSRSPLVKSRLPFSYDLTFGAKNAHFKLPFFDMPIQDMKGDVSLFHGTITEAGLEKDLGYSSSNASEMFSHLVKVGILSKQGRILYSAQFSGVSSSLRTYLESPPESVEFSSISGRLGTIPVSGDGEISLKHQSIDLKIKADSFYVQAFNSVFKDLSELQIKGLGKGVTYVNGPLNSPNIYGYMSSDKLNAYGFQPEDVYAKFFIKKNILNIDIKKAGMFRNLWSGDCKVGLSGSEQPFSMDLLAPNFNMSSAFPNMEDSAEGTSNVSVKIEDKDSFMTINLEASGETSRFFSQKVPSFSLSLRVKDDHDMPFISSIRLNDMDTPIFLKGQVRDSQFVNVNVNAVDISVVDVLTSNRTAVGLMNAEGDISFSLGELFWKNPLSETQATLSITAKNFPFYGFIFDEMKVKGRYDKGSLDLDYLESKKGPTRIDISGEYQNLKPLRSHINVSHLSIQSWPWLADKIPNYFHPFSGDLSVEMMLDNRKENSVSEGSFFLKKAKIQNQPIKRLEGKVTYKNGRFDLHDFYLKQFRSKLRAKGYWQDDLFSLSILKGSTIDLRDFSIMTAPYGTFEGQVSGTASFYGSKDNLDIDSQISAKNIRTNLLKIDLLKGKVGYKNKALSLSKVRVKESDNIYTISGDWDLSKDGGVSEQETSMKVQVHSAELSALISMIEHVVSVFKTGFIYSDIGAETVSLSNVTQGVTRDSDGTALLYNEEKREDVLDKLRSIQARLKSKNKAEEDTLADDYAGHISGSVEFFFRKEAIPLVKAAFKVEDFESAAFKAHKFSLDITPKNDAMTVRFNVDDAQLGESKFTQLAFKGGVDSKGVLWLGRTDITTAMQRHKNVIKGRIDLLPYWNPKIDDGSLFLDFNLEGDQLGVLSLLFNDVTDIRNKGSVQLSLRGSLKNPILSSDHFLLQDAVVYFVENHPLFNAPIHINDASLFVKDNVFTIPRLPIRWDKPGVGRFVQLNKEKNSLNLSGSLRLKALDLVLLDSFLLGMDIEAVSTKLDVSIPGVYRGKIVVSDLHVSGDLYTPFSDKSVSLVRKKVDRGVEVGPLITGGFKLYEGTVYVSGESSDVPLPMMIVSSNVTMGSDVDVSGGAVGRGLLAGITLDADLVEMAEPMRMSGTLNRPFFHGEFILAEGDIQMFSRSFELLKQNQQHRYLFEGLQDAKENSVAFIKKNTDSGPKIVPVIQLMAVATVEEITDVSANVDVDDFAYDHMTLSMRGPLDELKSLKFNHFTSRTDDLSSGELSYKNTYYIPLGSSVKDVERETDAKEILTILMPELFEGEGFESDAFFTQLSENKVNLIARKGLFRPIEKELASLVGLYDFRIDYNVGQDLFRADEDVNRELGLSVIQQILSEQLFLRIKTNIDLEPDDQESDQNVDISEIELTYFLLKNRNLSLNYANVKDDLSQQDFRPKLSLRFSHDF